MPFQSRKTVMADRYFAMLAELTTERRTFIIRRMYRSTFPALATDICSATKSLAHMPFERKLYTPS